MPAIEYIITDEDTGKQIGDPHISRTSARLEARRLQNEEGITVGLRHRHIKPGKPAATQKKANPNDFTKAELVEIATEHGLPTSGTKAQLIERIENR